jgi:hypothetical protein
MTILDLVQDHRSDIRGIVPHSFEESEVVAADDPKAVELVVESYGVDLAIRSEFAWGKVVFVWLVDKDIASSKLETGLAFREISNRETTCWKNRVPCGIACWRWQARESVVPLKHPDLQLHLWYWSKIQ